MVAISNPTLRKSILQVGSRGPRRILGELRALVYVYSQDFRRFLFAFPIPYPIIVCASNWRLKILSHDEQAGSWPKTSTCLRTGYNQV